MEHFPERPAVLDVPAFHPEDQASPVSSRSSARGIRTHRTFRPSTRTLWDFSPFEPPLVGGGMILRAASKSWIKAESETLSKSRPCRRSCSWTTARP